MMNLVGGVFHFSYWLFLFVVVDYCDIWQFNLLFLVVKCLYFGSQFWICNRFRGDNCHIPGI